MKKRKSLKKNVRVESLFPQFNTKVRRELLDADYLDKLNDDDLKWYAQFTDEYVGAAIRKTKKGSVMKGHIHHTNELAKKCYDANNLRNKDLYGVTKANHLMRNLDMILKDDKNGDQEVGGFKNPQLMEDYLNDNIDQKRSEDSNITFKEYIMLRKNYLPNVREQLDAYFSEQHPNSYLYYLVFETAKLTEYQLNLTLMNPELLNDLIKNPKLFKKKKRSTKRTKNSKNK